MSENLNSFDKHFRQRLTDLESSVPDDLFDRLQARRGAALPSDAPLRERLSAHETLVSDGIFDAVLAERERRKRRRVVMWRSVTAVAAALLLLFVALEFKNKNTVSMGKSAELNDVHSVENKVNNNELNTHKIVDNSDLKRVKTVDNNVNAIDLNNNKTIKNSENTEGGNSKLKIKNLKLNTPSSKLNTPNSELKMSNSELSGVNNSVSDNVEKQQIIINKKANFNTNKNANSNQKFTKTQSNNTIASTISDKLDNQNTELKRIENAKKGIDTEGSKNKLKIKNSEFKSVNVNSSNVSNNELNSVKTIGDNALNSELKNNNSELNTTKTIENSLNTEGSNSELNTVHSIANDVKNNALKTAFENRLSSTNFQTSTLDFLHILSVKTIELSTENRKNPCSDPGSGCPTFFGRQRMNHINYYVDAFVAPEYVMRSFKTNLPESEKLLTVRDSVEKTQYAVSTGVRGSVVFGSGISLRAGLVFNQMNERAQFDSLGTGSIKTTYDVRIVNGKPDTVSITTVITDGIFRKTRYNRYRSIDIPLQIGYHKSMKNGWTIGINGGINFNITAWQKADIVGTNLQKETVSSGINEANPVFRHQLGISLIGSVAAYRQLIGGLELMIEPSVRYGLQPITRSDYALKQQYSTAGLIVGLRLRL